MIEPEQRDAVLMCEGKCKKPKRHWFKARSRVDGKMYFKIIYECSVCGDARVWGTQVIASWEVQ
jgi:hypothetical protein